MATDLIASSPPLPQHELQFHTPRGVATSDYSFMPGPPSIASDGHSVVSGIAAAGLPPYLTSISPKPDYLSQYNASRVVTEIHSAQREFDSQDEETPTDDFKSVEVTEGAVSYINNFLDKLLHDVLSVAHSTELPRLRTASNDVLRKSLGREAVAAADANLEDLLALESDDEDQPANSTATAKWNLEYTWKRSRLRVMMRSEKSDFDIEDDERWVQQEMLLSPGRRFSDNATVISLQSEIFLAGVLDFISDQLLSLALIPASVRRHRASKRSPVPSADPTVLHIEEPDLEKGVLNSPLDKLWRTWRKTQRPRGWSVGSPRHDRSFSDVSSPATTRRGSQTWGEPAQQAFRPDLQTPRGMPGEFIETPGLELPQREAVPDMSEYPEHVIASNIPLPSGERDVDEIEVPGIARDPDEWEDELVEEPRRRSYMQYAGRQQNGATRPPLGRRRSSSAPAPTPRDRLQRPREQIVEEASAGLEPGATSVDGTAEPSEAAPNPENTFSLSTAQADQSQNLSDTVDFSGAIIGSTKERGHGNIDDQGRRTSPRKAAVTVGLGLSAATAGAVAASSKLRHAESATTPTSEEPPLDLQEGSPKPNRRNREAAVGFGYPNGISMPSQSDKQSSPTRSPKSSPTKELSRKDVAARIAPAKETSIHEVPPAEQRGQDMSDAAAHDLMLRAASPSSESEISSVLSPRDFMAKRNLPHTRSNDPGPPPSQAAPNRNKPMPQIQQQLLTKGLQRGENEASPVSPLSAEERAMDRHPDQASINDAVQSPSEDKRKPSAPAGRLTDDLARARGSPKVRQGSVETQPADGSPVHRKESLRRIAVERNGSLVSLVDENTHKIRSKAPITSSSITSSEDFDSLLTGGGTIKMTLSPQSVREAPSAPASRSGSIDSAAFDKLTGSGVLRKRQDSDAAKSPSMKSAKSPSIGSSDKSKRGRTGSDATVSSRRSISRPSLRNKSRTRAGLMAREPTVQTDSTRDFADFIRSTGPNKEPQTLVPALTNRQSTGPTSRQASVTASMKDAPRAPSISANGEPQVSQNTGIRYKQSLAAREARGSEPSGNAGLIDFIRTGPGNPKQNLPSKDIAPFRYSASSEDMKNFQVTSLDGPAGGLTPGGSTTEFGAHRASVSTMATTQTNTTYNSHAPLVSQSSYPPSTHSAQGIATPKVPQKKAKQSSATVDADGIRRYRNKDPYAIDISDDDDDDDYDEPAPVSQPARQKSMTTNGGTSTTDNSSGSLGDFMRDNDIASQMNMSNKDTRSAPAPVSAPAVSRRIEAPPASGLALNGVSFQPSNSVSTTISAGPISPPTSSRGPTAASTPATKAPAVSTPASMSTPSAGTQAKPAGVIPRNPNRTTPIARPGAGARAAVGGGSSTRDLADFLKNSGPSEPATPRERYGGGAPSPNIGARAGAGIGSQKSGTVEKGEEKKKFWQRKKYLDMP